MSGSNAALPFIAAGLLLALAIYFFLTDQSSYIWVYLLIGAALNVAIAFNRTKRR